MIKQTYAYIFSYGAKRLSAIFAYLYIYPVRSGSGPVRFPSGAVPVWSNSIEKKVSVPKIVFRLKLEQIVYLKSGSALT